MRQNFHRGLIGVLVVWGLLAWPRFAAAQDTTTVTGVVIDGTTEIPIPGVRVASEQKAVTTGPDGRFSVVLGEGETTLRLRADGHLETVFAVRGVNPEIRLFRNAFAETVEVVSETIARRRPSSNPIASDEVVWVAGSIDNVFRALDTLPGVASTDDFGSRLAVRGGTPDQNLTVMDGVEIHNSYRLFGITSAFNPETVANFQLTAGGFGVAYGDRLSSLLIIDSRRGSRDFQGATALSITDGNVVLEGTTPIWDNGTWLFSARRTYYDVIAGRLQEQNFPSFADLQLQAGWQFSAGHRVTLMGLRSVEDADLDIDGDRPGESAAFGSDVTNGLASARFDAVLGSRGTSTTIVSWYRNLEFLDFAGTVRADAKRSNASADDVAFGLARIVFDRSISVRDISVRQEFDVQTSPEHRVGAGLEVHRLNTGVGFTIRGDRNENEANRSSLFGGSGLPGELRSLLEGTRGGVWMQDTYAPSSRVSVEPGLRVRLEHRQSGRDRLAAGRRESRPRRRLAHPRRARAVHTEPRLREACPVRLFHRPLCRRRAEAPSREGHTRGGRRRAGPGLRFGSSCRGLLQAVRRSAHRWPRDGSRSAPSDLPIRVSRRSPTRSR